MILFTYGTRPEYLKVKPVIDAFKKEGIEYKVMCTGQHKDIVPNNENVYNLDIGKQGKLSSNRLDDVVATTLRFSDDMFSTFSLMAGINNTEDVTHVLVQGDTTSVLSLALSAFHHKKKIIHLEAGLRTSDLKNPFPEEANRQLVSRIADIHLAPTLTSKTNLLEENINQEKIHVVGNTALDNLTDYLDKCEYGDKVLITLHRRENHDIIGDWFHEIDKLSYEYNNLEFIIPLHPNPSVQIHKHIFNNVTVINPLEHGELLNLLVKSKLVITDSGGIQEECSFFKKKCLVCRQTTERPESVGLTSFLVKKPSMLETVFNKHVVDYIPLNHDCPYGDGDSSNKIVKLWNELINKDE